MKSTVVVIFFIFLLFTSSNAQPVKHGFYILQEDSKGAIVQYDQRYSINPKLSFSFHVADTAFTSFDHNGYPVLIIKFNKTDSVYRMLNNPNKQLAMFYDDSLFTNAKLLSFDSTYRVQLSGSFTLRESRELEQMILTAINKYNPPPKEPSFETIVVTDKATLKKTLLQCDSMTGLFVKALQQKNYELLKPYFFNDTIKQELMTRFTKHMTEEMAQLQIAKMEPRAKKYFDKLVSANEVNWGKIKFVNTGIQKLNYIKELDIYIADVYIFFTEGTAEKRMKFDELLYMNGRWWLFCEDIKVREN